jgi:hypothetical protein
MPAMTWLSLVGTIDSPGQIMRYLSNTNVSLDESIPDFIYQAEQRICRESKNIGLEMYVQGNLTPNVATLVKPARWRRSLTLGVWDEQDKYHQLFVRNYEFLRAYTSAQKVSALPKYYGDYGYEAMLLSPTPDQAYRFEYGYLQLPTPLSPENQTNWLTDYAPDVLLYAILLEAVPFLKNDERIPVWESAYARGLASLNQQDEARQNDRASNDEAD